ncbi:hydrocephalus-inducing protein homolog [Ceratina calcarata]|uniref:Hydrocephalus-inducing protein homolog n=1 Tax=Ceratina calcarata TaxID=156304 RepID=A0AAJ7S2F8_9HYME|nr:hydrocephalus-inducing protein homolog [Ceratina calcarata]
MVSRYDLIIIKQIPITKLLLQCYVESKLKINVKMSSETETIALTGRGIEKNLNVVESNIRFVPTIPFTEIQEVIFTVENACNYPVEFFWHHLDETFQMEEYISRVLLYYYDTKEILLPPRQPGEPIAWQLVQFYNQLVNEMAHTLIADKLEEEEGLLGEEDVQFKGLDRKRTERRGKFTFRKKSRKRIGKASRRFTARKNTARSSRRGKKNDAFSDVSSVESDRKDCPHFMDMDEAMAEPVPLPTNDPDEIQQLLYCYIDTLHMEPDFQKRMKDPVQELFESIEPRSNALNDLQDSATPEKRVCIIFHGAPFTEYQETACRSARVLGVPVLSIDKAITEVIGLGESACCIQLRQIIDDAYENYTQAYQAYLQLVEQEGLEIESPSSVGSPDRKKRSPRAKSSKSGSSKSPKRSKTPKSVQTEESELKEESLLPLRADPDLSKEFEKIPASDTLEMLDPLSRYEYKIQTILLLEKIVDPRLTRESPKDKGDKSPRKPETFLGISDELISEALQERLSAEDFKPGFVAQSLETNFLRSNTLEALLSLLRIIGHVEYLLFVTFLNSLPCYNNKLQQIQRKIAEQAIDPVRKIQEIDQMSLSEYEQLPEEDRKMYLDALLPIKKEAAESRRARSRNGKVAKKKKNEKPTKRSAKGTGKKSPNSKPASSKRDTSRATRSRDSTKRRKEDVSSGLKRVMVAMDRYYSDLSSIENVIRNWDPIRKILETPATTKSRMPRSGRSKEMGVSGTVREVIFVFLKD